MWEVSNQLRSASMNGSPMGVPNAARPPERICLTPANAARGPGLGFNNPGRCVTESSRIADGGFSYKLVCKDDGGSETTQVTASGTYTETTYQGRSQSVQSYGSSRVEMEGEQTARRLGDCSTMKK